MECRAASPARLRYASPPRALSPCAPRICSRSACRGACASLRRAAGWCLPSRHAEPCLAAAASPCGRLPCDPSFCIHTTEARVVAWVPSIAPTRGRFGDALRGNCFFKINRLLFIRRLSPRRASGTARPAANARAVATPCSVRGLLPNRNSPHPFAAVFQRKSHCGASIAAALLLCYI